MIILLTAALAYQSYLHHELIFAFIYIVISLQQTVTWLAGVV